MGGDFIVSAQQVMNSEMKTTNTTIQVTYQFAYRYHILLALFALITIHSGIYAQSGYYDRMERTMAGEYDKGVRMGLCGRCLELDHYVSEGEAGIRAFDYLVEQERWKAREIGWTAIAVTGLFLYSDGSGLGAPVLILGGGGIVIDGLSTWIKGRKILKGNL